MTVTWCDLERALISRGLLPGLVRDIIWAGIQEETLKVVTEAAMVGDQILEGEIPERLVLEHVAQVLCGSLVVTSPVSGLEGPLSPTLRAFQLIMAVATRKLDIVSPYIDAPGVEKLRESLSAAVKRGVRIRLLTRETARHQRSRSLGLEAIEGLAGRQLSVRDFHTQAEGRAHYTSVHAKLILANDQLGYVGSAELRGNALAKNFELGAIVYRESAAQAAEAFEMVWRVATPVKLEKVI